MVERYVSHHLSLFLYYIVKESTFPPPFILLLPFFLIVISFVAHWEICQRDRRGIHKWHLRVEGRREGSKYDPNLQTSTFEIGYYKNTSNSPLRQFSQAPNHGNSIYRDRLKGVQILWSNSQAGPGRKVKQEQEDISRNHVQAFFPGSVWAARQMQYPEALHAYPSMSQINHDIHTYMT